MGCRSAARRAGQIIFFGSQNPSEKAKNAGSGGSKKARNAAVFNNFHRVFNSQCNNVQVDIKAVKIKISVLFDKNTGPPGLAGRAREFDVNMPR